MEKEEYLRIVGLYKKENNLARLLYRFIKAETSDRISANMSYQQLYNKVIAIRGEKKTLQTMLEKGKIAVENFLHSEKCKQGLGGSAVVEITKVVVKDYGFDLDYTKNGRACTTIGNNYSIGVKEFDDYMKFKENINMEISNALQIIIDAGYVLEFEDLSFYDANKRKFKSSVTRYKALK
ncbi:hypothetical protein D3C81_07990 [compost metagenome]